MTGINPTVAQAAAEVPFDAAAYVWIDLANLPETSQDVYKRYGLDMQEFPIEKMPMLFEKMAVLPPQNNWGPKDVITLERRGATILYSSWLRGYPEFVYEGTVLSNNPAHAKDIHMRIKIHRDIHDRMARKFNGDEERMREWMTNAVVNLMVRVYYASVVSQDLVQTYSCVGKANNIKRIRRGKRPMYEWKTVFIDEAKRESLRSALTKSDRAKCREHEVRGHWATRKKSGKRYWVRAHKRGDASVGTIFHDYQLKGSHEHNQRPHQGH